jgi:hypothetical protein
VGIISDWVMGGNLFDVAISMMFVCTDAQGR